MASNEIIVPDALYERLRRVTGTDDGAIHDFAVAVIEREVEWLEMNTPKDKYDAESADERPQLTMAEWQERRQNRPVLHIDFDAAAIIRDEREQRDQEWYSHLNSSQKDTS